MNSAFIKALFVAAALLASSGGVRAQESLLFSFDVTNGESPEGSLLVDASGNLFGTTNTGGSMNGGGNVFELSPVADGGWTERVIHNFDRLAGSTDGFNPEGSLIPDGKGNLYGTTSKGGLYPAVSGGTVFELSPAVNGTWTEKVVYSFGPSVADGYHPTGTLVFDAQGNLYGTTVSGGAYNDDGVYESGTVFELSPMAGGGWTKKILHDFGAAGDGFEPLSGLAIDSSGTLYGTTASGGTYSGGTVYELVRHPDGSRAYDVVHNFNPAQVNPSQVAGDGDYPEAPVAVDSKGNLYGTTYFGGPSGNGVAFELSPTANGAWTEKILTQVTGNLAALVMDSLGNLYGTLYLGGTYQGGTVYKLTPLPDGSWANTVLHNFSDYEASGDGNDLQGGVVFDAKGNLYGTTAHGGASYWGAGTVFEIGAATVAMGPTITTTMLVIDPGSNLVAGEPITLTATVAPASGAMVPTGFVLFVDPAGGSVEVPLDGNGKAVYSGRVPAAGTYSVYATYGGFFGFSESHSATITETVAAR